MQLLSTKLKPPLQHGRHERATEHGLAYCRSASAPPRTLKSTSLTRRCRLTSGADFMSTEAAGGSVFGARFGWAVPVAGFIFEHMFTSAKS